MLRQIPCMYMRAGTSKGPFLDLRDFPEDEVKRNAMLLRMMGSPHKTQVDGIGGATPVTSKVVLVRPSSHDGVDVDYLFAQVGIEQAVVDTRPTCGKMMTGIGPFAIERGWVTPDGEETTVRVYSLNTNAYIEIDVQTPAKKVNYTAGNAAIHGVPGTSAPIWMRWYDVGGATTGHVLPTGNARDTIQGIDVSIVDAANLILLIPAEQLGLRGTEREEVFQPGSDFMIHLESIRREAGMLAGMGDVSESVLPRIAILSAASSGGAVMSQYLTPHTLHPSHAVSGAIGVATGCKIRGSVVQNVFTDNGEDKERIVIEHQAGVIPVDIEVGKTQKVNAGVLRTARKLMDGYVYV